MCVYMCTYVYVYENTYVCIYDIREISKTTKSSGERKGGFVPLFKTNT